MKIYTYKNCGTCRKAVQWLASNNVSFEEIPIREQPPTKPELRRMLEIQGGNLRKLFNTSGQDYKALGMKDKLPTLSTDDALDLLSKNGNLVKRPFVLTTDSGIVGFDEAEWKKLLKL
ncbi:MAG: arsenate reductase family protein [Verrucomicrobia bacterium]|nr:arsenate reductase family protein [Verrucomicrobiota bacterium]